MSDDLLEKRFRELALRAGHTGCVTFTRFLEPSCERDVLFAAGHANAKVRFWGGWEGAERRIAAFWTEEEPGDDAFPIVRLALDWNPKYGHPGHRDLLGSVMGLGLERDTTGDIVPAQAEGRAVLFAHEDVSAYIAANLESAGRTSLKVCEIDGQVPLKEPEGEVVRVTVAAPRMDAVIASGWKLSRGEAQKLINAGLVKRNHIVETRGDIKLESGDLLSVRGYGRMRMEEDLGLTRKGRSALRLFIYKT